MEVDWQSLFTLSMSPLELIVRGSAVYWFLFLIFRFLLKRDVGAVGIADVLLLVLVADAAQNAMAGEYRSITDGFILVATIIGWNFGLDYLAYKLPIIRRLVEPRAIRLVLESDEQGTFNIGWDGEAVALVDVARVACELTGAPQELIEEVEPPAGRVMTRIATERIRALGWRPEVPLDEGMRQLLDSLRAGAPA